ncbi:MAG: electron transfer flavoprotein subunit alpha/FixB family protein [Candidatus Bathyarchaeia archaeon]
MKEIWIYIETTGESSRDWSLQLINVGNEIAQKRGASLGCVLIGNGLEKIAEDLIRRGAMKVYIVEDKRLEIYQPNPFGKALSYLCETKRPEMVILPASTQGNDLSSYLSFSMRTGSVEKCDLFEEEGGEIVARRVEFEGLVSTGFKVPERRPMIFTLNEGTCEPASEMDSSNGEIIHVDIPFNDEDFKGTVVERRIAKRAVNLKDAKVIVAAGAGVGNRETFRLLEELARVLRAEIGATRAAVDAGWVSPDRQIGQTGVKVKPDLYIACGISGAVQHRVGMIESRKIVAINNDPGAPILRFCHYGIIGDLHEVIPRLIEEIAGKKVR